MLDIKLKNYQIGVILFGITALALFLRLLGYEHITFGYDQARDAMESMKIITTDHIKLVGPTTDFPGLTHGPLYWYLISPFYFFSNGNPYIVKLFLVLINTLCVPTVYLVASRIFKNRKVGLLSAYLFAISYESIMFARWLSNPSPALLSILISGYGLWLMWNHKAKGISIFLIAWAVSVQLQFFLVYQFVFFILVLILRFNIIELITQHRKDLLIGIVGSVVILSTFIASMIKFRFAPLIVLFTSIMGHKGSPPYPPTLFGAVELLSKNVNNMLAPMPLMISVIVLCVFIVIVCLVDRERRIKGIFTLLWFLSPLLVYLLGRHHSNFLSIGGSFGLFMLVGFCITHLTSKMSNISGAIFLILSITLITALNYSHFRLLTSQPEELFSVQGKADIKDQRSLVDWIYFDSGSNNFAINSVTNPLLVNATWAFHFNWYGKEKYGAMPAWKGADQVGMFGSEVVYATMPIQTGKTLYLILEPGGGIPKEYYDLYPAFENRRSKLISEKKFGTYSVQKRIFISEAGFDFNELINFVLSNGKSVKKT